MALTLPIRSKKDIRKLEAYYLTRGELRNHLLVVMSIHTALRISDLLRLTWQDVYDFNLKHFRKYITLKENKTQKIKTFPINNKIISALKRCFSLSKKGDFLFQSRKGGAIGRIQAYRIIKAAALSLNFPYRVSCHSLRKTFGYMAWKSGISLAVIMEIYNHSNFAVTRRYLGITQDDTDEAYHKIASFL